MRHLVPVPAHAVCIAGDVFAHDVYVAGDLPAHDVWLQSEDSNLHVIQVVAAALRKYFPNIPVLPAIGNHEAFPVNMFPGQARQWRRVWERN